MTLVKVVANDSSYCSKFFLFERNLKNGGARAKKRNFDYFLNFYRGACNEKLLRTSNIIQSLK